MSLSEGTKMIVLLRHLVKELDCEQKASTSVREDNQCAVIWGPEGVRHAKHVSIRKNFVKENVKHGIIRLVYCPTELMNADVLKKPLQRLAFERHRQALGVISMSA